MRKYRIISDSSCDLPDSLVEKYGITVVPFYITMDDKVYLREGIDISKDEFYQWMVDHKTEFPKSSMPSVNDFEAVFRDAAAAGEDVICICITEKFSSSYRIAMSAAEIVKDDYPEMEIAIVDSMVDTVLQGLFTIEACKLRDSGAPLDDAVTALEAIRPTGRIFFTVGNIDYLKHGGRIGKLAGIAGTALGVRPIITLKEGEIFPAGIARSRSKSIDKFESAAISYIKETFKTADEFEICVGYGYDRSEGEAYCQRLMKALADAGYEKEVLPYHIGATISVHTGPYPLGIGVLKKAL